LISPHSGSGEGKVGKEASGQVAGHLFFYGIFDSIPFCSPGEIHSLGWRNGNGNAAKPEKHDLIVIKMAFTTCGTTTPGSIMP
jgi:hypothetical protein